MSIARLHQEMDAREIAEWIAYFRAETEIEEEKNKKEAGAKLQATLKGLIGKDARDGKN